MSTLTDWIKNELYPALFESIPHALPEHNFNRYAGGWRSNTYLNGEPHKDRKDKTVISKKAPAYIMEQGGDSIDIVSYVMKRDNVGLVEAVKTLAAVAGVEVPPHPQENQEAYQKQRERGSILEDANSYFIYCLEHAPGAEGVRSYLQGRGYSREDIAAMELGYIPSQEKLFSYLTKKGYSLEAIQETLILNKGIGDTHRLTLPFRSGGSLKGFTVRTIEEGVKPKYLNSTGLDRSETFFNIKAAKGDKDIVIVEGYLDVLISEVRGVENVVALAGANITKEQIKDAVKRGAKRFTLCLDRDKTGREATQRAIKVILGEGVNRVYIADLPELGGGKTDPDQLIKERGVEAFRAVITGALPYHEYQLQETLHQYSTIQEERGYLTSKEIDSLLEEVVETATKLEPTDRDRYKKAFTSLDAVKELGITEESLSITVDRITSTRDKERQTKELSKLLSEAAKLQGEGKTGEALELLDAKTKEVKLQDKATEFSGLLLPIKEEELRQRQANKPDSLNSGYTIGGEELLLPAGAISVLAAPTSHGKTTLLINLALNVAKAYPEKQAYFFSYEEDGDSILINTLNTYIDTELSTNNRRSLKTYFTTGSPEYIKHEARDLFKAAKESFFRELISPNRLNIHYTNYNSDTLIEAIRYIHKHANPGAIFIDYIQLLNLPEGKYKTYSRQEEIKEICIALKDVAVETGLPIILGAQFNREVVNQLRLHATKIGEAGDIERIANLIVGFWNNNFKPLISGAEENEINVKGYSTPDTLYATILKNRGGRVGLEELLSFNGNTGKVKNSGGSGYNF